MRGAATSPLEGEVGLAQRAGRGGFFVRWSKNPSPGSANAESDLSLKGRG